MGYHCPFILQGTSAFFEIILGTFPHFFFPAYVIEDVCKDNGTETWGLGGTAYEVFLKVWNVFWWDLKLHLHWWFGTSWKPVASSDSLPAKRNACWSIKGTALTAKVWGLFSFLSHQEIAEYILWPTLVDKHSPILKKKYFLSNAV